MIMAIHLVLAGNGSQVQLAGCLEDYQGINWAMEVLVRCRGQGVGLAKVEEGGWSVAGCLQVSSGKGGGWSKGFDWRE